MTSLRLWSPIALPLLALSLFGCDGSVTIEPPSMDAGAATGALYEGDPTMLYPVCRIDDAHRCPPDAEGYRGSYGFAPSGACFEACQCRYACEHQTDCPAPFTGTASPQCSHGTCVLRCDGRFACPDGMACVEDDTRGARWCMWVTQRVDCEE